MTYIIQVVKIVIGNKDYYCAKSVSEISKLRENVHKFCIYFFLNSDYNKDACGKQNT